MPLFGRSKTPRDIVINLRESLLTLQQPKNERERIRALNEITKHINTLKEQMFAAISAASVDDLSTTGGYSSSSAASNNIPFGHGGCSSAGDATQQEGGGGSSGLRIKEMLSEVAVELENQDTLFLLINSMNKIDFECSKYAVDLFCLLMHRQSNDCDSFVRYLCRQPRLFTLCIQGYDLREHASLYGSMLRESVRHVELARALLHSDEFYLLFKYVQDSTFDVSSDAFQTLRDLLTRHRSLVSRFFEDNYTRFFEHYHILIGSDNYVTRRLALKLLSELLLERANYSTMKRYIDDVDNLKLIMNLLKAQEKQIAFEAFHCFKIFAANPQKTRAIHSILFLNREKLVDFLEHFLSDRNDDVQFCDERAYLVKVIRELKAYQAQSSPPSATQQLSQQPPPPSSTAHDESRSTTAVT